MLQSANKLCSRICCATKTAGKNYENDHSLKWGDPGETKKTTLNVSSVTSDSSAQLDKTLIDYSEAAGTEKILSTGWGECTEDLREQKILSPLPPVAILDSLPLIPNAVARKFKLNRQGARTHNQWQRTSLPGSNTHAFVSKLCVCPNAKNLCTEKDPDVWCIFFSKLSLATKHKWWSTWIDFCLLQESLYDITFL